MWKTNGLLPCSNIQYVQGVVTDVCLKTPHAYEFNLSQTEISGSKDYAKLSETSPLYNGGMSYLRT